MNIIFRLAIGFLIIGAVSAHHCYVELQRAYNPKSKAEALTLEELLNRGAEGNTHVVVWDFLLGPKFEAVKNPDPRVGIKSGRRSFPKVRPRPILEFPIRERPLRLFCLASS